MHVCADVHRLTKVPSASDGVLNNRARVAHVATGVAGDRRDVLQQRLLVRRKRKRRCVLGDRRDVALLAGDSSVDCHRSNAM